MNYLSEYCSLHVKGEVIPPTKWLMRYEEDDDFVVYYLNAEGKEIGTQSSEIEIHDPVYGRVFPR